MKLVYGCMGLIVGAAYWTAFALFFGLIGR